MRLRCYIGIHDWWQTRPLSYIDAYPPTLGRYECPARTCQACGKHQQWLPGYGGSEAGCWIDAQATPKTLY